VEHLKKELYINGKLFIFEIGALAKQANGSCLVRVGDTIILATVTTELNTNLDIDFLPLTVDYRERAYAAGKIPGGFFKRENKPKDSEVLVSRLIDRTIRPIFPKSWRNTTQVTVIVLSYDNANDHIISSMLGASMALYNSNIPFNIPVASVRIGKIGDKYLINPSFSEQQVSELNLVISGTENSITMLEANALELSELHILDALEHAHSIINQICIFQKQEFCKQNKFIMQNSTLQNEELQYIEKEVHHYNPYDLIKQDKHSRDILWSKIKNDILTKIVAKYSNDQVKLISYNIESVFNQYIRDYILKNKTRMDGRGVNDIRNIDCKNGILPRVHGSSLFTRGETQALATVTLGTPIDMQIMDELHGEYKDRFIFNYNFPGFATGEPKSDRSVSRREIGHGYLAKKAISPILPEEKHFAYTIRVVSDILESNGSSSMASVCAASLALKSAGVPIKNLCSGIAMGLIKEKSDYVILTDIMGVEDHLGDMDFKIAGTTIGITALQLDVKQLGIDISIIYNAMKNANQKRLEILDIMKSSFSSSEITNISHLAPSIAVVNIPKSQIGDLIGPGGRNIRKIQDEYNIKIDIDQKGRVFISGTESKHVSLVKKYIESFNVKIIIGHTYDGIIIKKMDFGIFVEIAPGKKGLVHLSQLKKCQIKEGNKIKVKIINIDKYGKINLKIQ
jgi:polyribonucleotide nucleotidyltransferase